MSDVRATRPHRSPSGGWRVAGGGWRVGGRRGSSCATESGVHLRSRRQCLLDRIERCVEVVPKVGFADTLDEPADLCAATIPELVPSGSLSTEVRGVDIDLEGPTARRIGEIEAQLPVPAHGQGELAHDADHSSTSEMITDDRFPVGPGGASREAVVQQAPGIATRTGGRRFACAQRLRGAPCR